MSPSSSVTDPNAGWQALDAVLDDLERWTAHDRSSDEFWTGLLERLSSIGFEAATVWLAGPDGRPEAVRSKSWPGPVRSDSPRASEAITSAWQSSETQLLDGAEGPSVFTPWRLGDTPDGALQVWLRRDVSLATAKGFVRFLEAIGGLIATFRLRQEHQRLRRQFDLQSRLDELAQRLHERLDLDETAYRIANDGRLFVGCDRVVLLVRRGRKFKTLTISGAEHVHRHATAVHCLERLCAYSAAIGPLWHEGKTADLPPQVDTALAEYLDASAARTVAAVPLAVRDHDSDPEPRIVGMLVCEQYAEAEVKPFEPAARIRIESLLPHASRALNNALHWDAVPGRRLWSSLAHDSRFSRRPVKGLVVGGLLAGMLAALLLVPAEVRVKARGELQPALRPEVFAPRDGVVTTIFVDHGHRVRAGDKLVELRSLDLDLELQKVQGELETTRKQLAAAQSERLQVRPGDPDARLRQRRLTADEEQFQEQVRGLEHRQTMLRRQQEELTIRAPADGEVLTWNVRQRLAMRPLRRGESLLTIGSPEGPWQLELRVPGRSAGRVVAAHRQRENLPASFALTTDPAVQLSGVVNSISQRMETDELGETYLSVIVAVARDNLPHRVPGATAVAFLDCGRGSLGEAWFHELLDAVRLWITP